MTGRPEALSGMEAVIAAGGDAGALMREVDWARTPLGPMSAWPQSLRSAASICLLSRFPMVVWWGPELVFIFNDAYRPVLGVKDPRQIMGRVGREVWPEIWPIIGPMLDGVLNRGEATWSDDQLLLLERNGYLEECYFTFSYSPIHDESGGVGGVFTAVTETSQRVIGERRLRTLSELAERTAGAKSAEEACARAVDTMARNPHDLPVSFLYLLQEDGAHARLVASSGAVDAVRPASSIVRPGSGDAADWPLSLATMGEAGAPVPLLDMAREGAPAGDDVPLTGVVLPIVQAGQPHPAGWMVTGVSRRRALDEDYQRFFELVAGQVGTAIADAQAYQIERRRAEALAELDRAKTAFFSNVSHEFRTPLTLMLGPLEQALGRLPDEERGEVEIAHRNATRLLRLVNTLLDFSRIEAGRIEASYEPVDLSRLTADLASAFRSAVEAAGLELVVDCPPLAEPAYVDVEMWEKIVLNLLSNAFKFTFDGHLGIGTRLADGRFEVTVTDTGVGIPDAELPRLFDRFHRVRGARSRTHEGTGIGLALVRDLVALHGGTIDVRSVPGEGSSFTVSLPTGSAHLPADRLRARRELPSTGIGAAPFVEEAMRWLPAAGGEAAEATWSPREVSGERGDDAGETGGARLLVVDDNADMREYLCKLLSPHWEVEAAADGLTALNVARTVPPDLVLTDVMMPGLDGFELLDALRADSATRHVPVVMLSARAGAEATVEGLRAGADDYLIKPFAARELVARVRANLELSRMRLLARTSQERYDEAERALERALDSLAAVAHHIRSEGDVKTFFARISETIAQLVSARRAVFFRLEGGEIHAQEGAFGFKPELLPLLRTPVEEGGGRLADRIVFDGEVFNAQLDESEQLDPYRQQIDVSQARDAVAVPWRMGDEPLGIVAVYDSLKPGGFTRDDVWVLRISSLAASLVWEHRQAEAALTRHRHREASELQARIARSAELERIKSDFLKLASHELRGPLSVVRGYVSMIQDGTFGEQPSSLESVLPIVEGKLREMNALINQMLETARLEDERLALRIERLDLRDVVREAVEEVAPLVPATHDLQVILPHRPVPLEGDVARLRTVISNLVHNAIRYSPAGGTVEVRCLLRPGHQEALVEVRDQGLGIAHEDLPRLFERFGRIVTPENSHIPGTGLGLYLAQELTRRHGGVITVTSKPQVGSTFVVTLPLAAAAGPAAEGEEVPGRRRPATGERAQAPTSGVSG